MSNPTDSSLEIAPQNKVLAVIPARYGSSRFPGKPLVSIQGKPMIQHVWERVRSISEILETVVATDDERIAQVIWDLGGQAQLTHPDHQSGTDRVWEVASKRPEFNWVLNVQGDEPFIEAAALQSLIQHLLQLDHAGSLAEIGTLITPITSYQEWCDPNVVKAVVSEQGNALYFSRSPVPYPRDTPQIPVNAYRHLGIYLFKRRVLEKMTQWPVSPLEAIEKLEQLRALEKGVMISTHEIPKAPLGVDTPEDLERLVRSLS